MTSNTAEEHSEPRADSQIQAPTGSVASRVSPSDEVRKTVGKPRRSVLRWVWRGVGLLLLGVLVFAVYTWQGRTDRSAAPEYVSVPARRGDLNAVVTATGSLEALGQVDVGAELSGRVVKVNADFNDRVEEGQVLCELDSAQFSAAAKQSRAQLQANEASLKSALATSEELDLAVQRSRALHAEGILSRQELESAEASAQRAKASVELAKSQIALAHAALESSQTALRKTVIRSPISGVVLSRSVEPGQTVAATLSAPVLFTLARDLKRMELHINIDEADIGQVAEGQTATFAVDTHPGRTFPAQLTAIHNLATTKDNVVTYEALLLVQNDDMALRPGMTATVTIVSAERRDVLLVPNTALRFTPPSELARENSGPSFGLFRRRTPAGSGSPKADPSATPNGPGGSGQHQAKVWVLESGVPRAVPLELGLSDGEWTEVVAGDLSADTPLLVDVITQGS